MNYMRGRVVRVSSVSELPGTLRDLQLITIINPDTFVAYCADPATKYLVTFETTIKPLTEEASISDSLPLTDGLDR